MVKEGIYWFLILVSLGIISLKFFGSSTFYLLPSTFFLLSLFVLYFFRNPERKVEHDKSKIYSACDGKVLEVESRDNRKIIKVFMNVLNCHIQRNPYNGEVKKIEYKEGKFLPAFKKEAEFENEQNFILIKTEKGNIGVTQIAGILARRIACWIKEGDKVSTGDTIGMIKLGSQVDVSLPEFVKVKVRVGDKVFAGRTVIAEW